MSQHARLGGRHPDPGMGAVCNRCDEPRLAHGGPKKLGACPDQSGLRARRFQLRDEDKPDVDPEPVAQARVPLPPPRKW